MDNSVVSTQSSRMYGIDILRMVAMLMILVLHVIGYGTTLFNGYTVIPPELYVPLYFQILCGVGVTVYGLISGYVSYGKKVRFSNLAVLWLRVFYYAVIISVIFFATGLREFSGIDLAKSFFPTVYNYWWYWTAYFAVFLFSPLINLGLERINRRTGIILFIVFFIVFSILPTFSSRRHIFDLETGLSVVWLLVLFVMGGLIKKLELFKSVKTWIFVVIYFTSSLVIFGTQILFDTFPFEILGVYTDGGMFHNYISPFTLISSISLLIIFSRINVGKEPIQKVISFISPSVFSVYLIHSHYIMLSASIKGRFVFVGEYNQFLATLMIIGISLAIFAVCILIDIPRELLFKYTKIKKRLYILEEKLFKRETENIQ